jgi:hypothetical protein
MLHRVLYQDDYVMLSAGLFGGLRIHLLDRKILRKLSAHERAVVSATVAAARKNGAPRLKTMRWPVSFARCARPSSWAALHGRPPSWMILR